MSSKSRKRDILVTYLRNVLGGLIALPVSLLIISVIILGAVLILPFLWMLIIMWWANGFKNVVNGDDTVVR
jgi:hypothetical protein